jgi:hypothetical protein
VLAIPLILSPGKNISVNVITSAPDRFPYYGSATTEPAFGKQAIPGIWSLHL